VNITLFNPVPYGYEKVCVFRLTHFDWRHIINVLLRTHHTVVRILVNQLFDNVSILRLNSQMKGIISFGV
jgi:hypothetical protein